MNTTVAISLDSRRRKKDGSFPVVLRLGHYQRTTSIGLGFSVQLADWDDKKHKVRATCKVVSSASRLNNYFIKRKSQALEIISKLEEAGKLASLSISDLRNFIEKQPETLSSFFSYTEKLIEQMLKARKVGNARVYKNVFGAFKNYRNGRDLRFEEITYAFLKEYEAYYLGQGFKLNGLSVNLRTLRSIYNKAILEGIADQNNYPFKRYRIQKGKTVKRAIDQNALQRIVQLNLEPDNPCFNARNYFLASFMMNGMSFIDMAFLKVKDIVNDRIRYRGQKNGRPYDLKLTDSLKELLSFYLKGKTKEDFVFPFIRHTQLSDQYNDVYQARKMYNKGLKELAKICEIDDHLTSYVSRHSFATHAMMKEVPLNAISSMLGHSSLATTEIYLKSLPIEILDEYQDKLSLTKI